jgi:hypothetical protein
LLLVDALEGIPFRVFFMLFFSLMYLVILNLKTKKALQNEEPLAIKKK